MNVYRKKNMNRRQLILGLVSAALIPPNLALQARAEAYPISRADIQKVPKKYRRKAVRFSAGFEPGTVVIDTRQKFLYLVQPGGRAIRYGIGVGRQGFSWSGTAVVRRKAKWPTWTPPASMVERDEFAAEWAGGMPGGPRNPLGARALYLFQGDVDTLYRIHGTFVPSSVGKAVSSGCIRMINADVADLYERVPIGTRVVVQQNATRNFLNDEDFLPRGPNRRRFFWFEY
jgi:lipoprotein-anchoring transpeptidase ErfK/SrfK